MAEDVAPPLSNDRRLPDRLPDDERRTLVRTLIGQMGGERERQALLRFHVAGESSEEVSTALNLSVERLHRVLHRSRGRYQTLLRGRLMKTRPAREASRKGAGRPAGRPARELAHQEIDGAALVDRYHPGDLSAEERARFEAHFAACPGCRADLDAARDLHRTLRQVAVDDVTEVALARAGVATWMARRGRYLGTVLGILLLTVVGLGAVWYGSRLHHQEKRLETAHGEVAALRATVEDERRRAAELADDLAARERRWREERGALLDRLGAPRPVVDRGRVGEAFSLAVDLSEAPDFALYTITVTTVAGDVEIRRQIRAAEDPDLLVVSFAADRLPQGNHRLLVEGIGDDGRSTEVAAVPFRIVGEG